jgi:glycosyltransferase involved in cell wall biosynthesis
MSPRASLLLATYEMPRHLALVCAALEGQSSRDYEVIFCDDGSGEETRRVIETFKARASVPVHHAWQEHQGFRKCRILNEGLRQSRGRTLIFLDGDCVPHRDYIRDHLDLQENGRYLAGRRVELGPRLSARLTAEKVRLGFFNYPRLEFIRSCLAGDSEYLNRSLRMPWPRLRKALKMDRIADLKGCNYSVPREALEALNGFDEAYEGYGREDTDVELRLQNLGLRIKSLKGVALQFHVWHPRREFTSANDSRLEELKVSRRVRCEQGYQRS